MFDTVSLLLKTRDKLDVKSTSDYRESHWLMWSIRRVESVQWDSNSLKERYECILRFFFL